MITMWEYILRIGSAGAYSDELQLFDMGHWRKVLGVNPLMPKRREEKHVTYMYPSLKMNACILKNGPIS